MDILFKPRVEATERMAQNCMDISQSKNQRERKITYQCHVHSLYVVVFSCFNFILRLETQVERTVASNLLLPYFFDIERMSQNVLLKIYEGNVSSIRFSEFILDIVRKILN